MGGKRPREYSSDFTDGGGGGGMPSFSEGCVRAEPLRNSRGRTRKITHTAAMTSQVQSLQSIIAEADAT